MKDFVKISKYNLIIFLVYAIPLYVAPRGMSQDNFFLFFTVGMVFHVVILFLLSIINLIQKGSNGPGLSLLINSFLVALIGFSSCVVSLDFR